MSGSGYTLGVIGCGTMGVAILSGVIESLLAARSAAAMAAAASSSSAADEPLASSTTSLADEDLQRLPTRFIACVNRQESAKRLKKTFASPSISTSSTSSTSSSAANGSSTPQVHVQVLTQGNLQAAKESDVILLACKPHIVKEVLAEPGMREALDGKLVCSICAGLRIEQIRAWVTPGTKVVRAMPNTPCKIREGMTVLTPLPPGDQNSALDRSILLSIFSAVGRARVLDEKYFDACTALAGSGPAFACVFLEAMADGGVMMGLPRAEALELAAQSMSGAARMVLESGMHPAALKDSVTTPGGCTIAGLLNLEDGRLRSTVARTIQAAAEHAAGLGQK